MNDEQASSRRSAALEHAAPVLDPLAPVGEPAALADPSAPRTQAGTRGQVNEEAAPASSLTQAGTRGQVDGGAAPASSLTQPGTRGQMNEEAVPASSLSLTERLLAWVREFIQFGMVGATAYIVDAGLFNLLQHGPLGVLAGHPNTAQFVAAATATLYSWIANRLWTYRGRTQANATREAVLFSSLTPRHRHHPVLPPVHPPHPRVHLGAGRQHRRLRRRLRPGAQLSASSSTTTWSLQDIRARRFKARR